MTLTRIKQLVPKDLIILIQSRLKQDWNDEEFNLHFDEFLKFMYLLSLYGGMYLPVNQDIDDIWHEYILQTLEYEKFCLALPNKRFLHHQSGSFEDYIENKSREEVIKEALHILPMYYKHFGAFSEKLIKIWPILSHLIAILEMDLKEINQIAAESAEEF